MKNLMWLMIILLIDGCSSLSKEECASANWQKLGQSDAERGFAEPKTEVYRKDCSEHGLKIKSDEYIKGYKKGLAKYCTHLNGLNRGKEGKKAHSYCEQINPDFKQGYEVGYKEFQREESKKSARQSLINMHGSRECTFDGDCPMEVNCSFGKCDRTGAACSFSSECRYTGMCNNYSRMTEFGDLVQVGACSPN